jgi:beta-mannosidase
MAHLRRIVNEMDPTRPYHDPDPEVVAQRHAPHSYDHTESYRIYNTGRPMSAGPAIPLEWTEYGASAASSVETLKRIMPAKSLWPVRASDPNWVWHKAFRAFGEHNWLGLPQVTALFGEMPDLETLVRASQFVQAEALRYANQSMRRRKWHLSACAFWAYNEPWPNAAHGCVVEHYGAPKMAYYYVKQSYAPVDVSAVYDGLIWTIDTPVRIPIWIVNDTDRALRSHRCSYSLHDVRGAVLLEGTATLDAPAEASRQIADVAFTPPAAMRGETLLFRLELRDSRSRVVARNVYTFGVRGEGPPLDGLLKAPRTALSLRRLPGHVEVVNTGSHPALFVHIMSENPRTYPEDDYLFLMPGERRSVRVPGEAAVTAKAWNSGAL